MEVYVFYPHISIKDIMNCTLWVKNAIELNLNQVKKSWYNGLYCYRLLYRNRDQDLVNKDTNNQQHIVNVLRSLQPCIVPYALDCCIEVPSSPIVEEGSVAQFCVLSSIIRVPSMPQDSAPPRSRSIPNTNTNTNAGQIQDKSKWIAFQAPTNRPWTSLDL